MPELSLWTGLVAVAALVIGILAGHFGWGRRWPRSLSTLHPDYLAGLDYLVTEQPDRALDMFLKLMDANADTIETHFSLGSLYRRRGEVERAIRIHQNLLARDSLAPEHREQALLALAQDYLRAGLLDRAERLFQEVSEVPRLRSSALAALRDVFERQLDWPQALDVHHRLRGIDAAPPRSIAAHYHCELAALALEKGDLAGARASLRAAEGEVSPFPRALLIAAQIAEREGDREAALARLRSGLEEAPQLIREELHHVMRLAEPPGQDALLANLLAQAEARGLDDLKQAVFAALAAGFGERAPLREPLERVLARHATLRAMLGVGAGETDSGRMAREIGALLAHAENYRCQDCGFAGRHFYWHCPACHAWDSFAPYTIVKLG